MCYKSELQSEFMTKVEFKDNVSIQFHITMKPERLRTVKHLNNSATYSLYSDIDAVMLTYNF